MRVIKDRVTCSGCGEWKNRTVEAEEEYCQGDECLSVCMVFCQPCLEKALRLIKGEEDE